MLPPDIFQLGPIHLRWYGLMLGIAFIICLELSYRRARKYGFPQELIAAVAFWGLLSGLLGARIGYILSHTQEFSFGRPLEWIAIWQGGQTFFGGLAGGLVGLTVVVYLRRAKWWEIADLMAPVMALGHAIGRIGCFMRGCCYGKVTEMWCGIRFPDHIDADSGMIVGSDVYLDHLASGRIESSAQWSLPVHPTQLYSVAALLVISAVLWRLYDRRTFDGMIAVTYLILYGIWRFAIEFVRTEPRALFGLTVWQWTSICMVAAGVIAYACLRKLYPIADRQKPVADSTAC